jgi:hypothetical protein
LQERNPFEYLTTLNPASPWLVQPAQHTADLGRTLDAHFITADVLETISARDWNDDLVTARELPRETASERVQRYTYISRCLIL